jgi:hypothetical protein
VGDHTQVFATPSPIIFNYCSCTNSFLLSLTDLSCHRTHLHFLSLQANLILLPLFPSSPTTNHDRDGIKRLILWGVWFLRVTVHVLNQPSSSSLPNAQLTKNAERQLWLPLAATVLSCLQVTGGYLTYYRDLRSGLNSTNLPQMLSRVASAHCPTTTGPQSRAKWHPL